MNRWADPCRPSRPRFLAAPVTTRLRAWLPSNRSQNSLFCRLLPTQVTTPVFEGGGPLFTAGASRLLTLTIRSEHKATYALQTSLEEAEVRSPDREVGEESTHTSRAPKVRHTKDDACLAPRLGEFPMDILRLALVILMFAFTAAWSQQMPAPRPLPPGVEISIDARPRTATVGDPIRIELTVSLPQGFQARLPELRDQVGDFSVLEPQASPAPRATPGRNAAGKADSTAGSPGIRRASYVVALFRPGSFEFPPLPISIRDASGKEYSAASPPVKIEISSVLTGEDEKLKDLKRQAEIEDPAKWLYRLGIVLLLLTLALLGWLLWRKRQKPALPRAVVPGLDPYDSGRGRFARPDRPRPARTGIREAVPRRDLRDSQAGPRGRLPYLDE